MPYPIDEKNFDYLGRGGGKTDDELKEEIYQADLIIYKKNHPEID